VSALKGLTNLVYLRLDGNTKLTRAQIAELQNALPKCRIYSSSKK